MSDRNKDLLIPRYEVIADYPKNPFKVGDILNIFTEVEDCERFKGIGIAMLDDKGNLPKYPHLFRRLQWWEKRSIEELPEYVKIDNPNFIWEDTPKGCVRKVAAWKLDSQDKIICDLFPLMVNNMQLCRLSPATESDYLTYQKQKDGK